MRKLGTKGRVILISSVPSPWILGLNHSKWRPYQYEALEKIKRTLENKRIAILEAPTGTGKTAIATALSNDLYRNNKATVVVQNLGLLEQYRDYGFSILKGRQAYPCIDPDRVSTWQNQYGREPTAADCPYTEMYQCRYGAECPYMEARERALASSRMACTYKYASLSEKVQNRGGLFVMDEIHNAVSEILGIGSFSMDDFQRDKLDLPDFPLKNYCDGEGGLLDDVSLVEITGWILESMHCLGNVNLFDEITPEGSEKKKMLDSLTGLMELLAVCHGEIFYKCYKVKKWIKGSIDYTWSMEFRTISPSYLYYKMTSEKDKILMMSATVGSPKALIAGELRIGRDDYGYMQFPHPIPVNKRPIFDISIAPMSHSNLDSKPYLYDRQAWSIAKWISEYTDRSWRGVILTTSYKKIEMLRKGIGKYLGEHRVFKGEANSLQERIQSFIDDKTPSVVHIDTIQGWGTGVDLRGDIARYCVVAGVPFPNPTDAFEKIRINTPTGRAYATAFAYNAVVQAAGRVSRGEKQDGEYIENYGALADKLATSPYARKHYSKWFLDAIVKIK